MAPAAADARVTTSWIMLLTIASTATTVTLACATPFQALAALAATRMRARDGIVLMLACWVASQAVGFGLHHYPRDASTIGWALALAGAAVCAVVAARLAVARLRSADAIVATAIAFVAATIAFKAVVLLGSLILGDTASILSPAINARQFVRNGAILAGLCLLHRGLVAIGVPPPRPPRRVAA